MLIDIKLANFKSIKSKQTFSMIASNKVSELSDNVFTIKKRKFLKSAILYGANGSGKSNLIYAFNTIHNLVNYSANNKIGEPLIYYLPHLLDSNSQEQPCEVEIRFLGKNDLEYNYFLSFNQNKVIEETLNFYPGKNPALLFERKDGQKIKYGSALKQNLSRIENSLYDNQLFLSKVGSEKVEALIQPYTFLTRHISVHNMHDTTYDNLLVQALSRTLTQPNKSHIKHNITQLMKVADIGIRDMLFENFSEEKLLPESNNESRRVGKDVEINTIHKKYKNEEEAGEIQFPIQLESTGTNKLLSVGLFLLEALDDGDVIIIDELDKSLHPFITKLLIQIINSRKTNPKNAQLIFASHDVSLLNNKLFRRDQIHFAEKTIKGESCYYQLSDVAGVRQSVSYEKYYMNGLFGGVPLINQYDLDFKFNK